MALCPHCRHSDGLHMGVTPDGLTADGRLLSEDYEAGRCSQTPCTCPGWYPKTTPAQLAAATARARQMRHDHPEPDIRPGDFVKHRGSLNGRAIVRELIFVNAKPKHGGPRWRLRVAYRQNRAGEIGPKGASVEQHIDAAGVEIVDYVPRAPEDGLVDPVVNPPLAPVAEAPFSLTAPIGKPGAVQGSLF